MVLASAVPICVNVCVLDQVFIHPDFTGYIVVTNRRIQALIGPDQPQQKGRDMLTIVGRFADIYSSKIDAADFINLKKNGLDSDEVYERLDDMPYLVGGIASFDIRIWINDECVVESFAQLSDRFDVRTKEELDLRKDVDGEHHTFAIVEYSKISARDDSISGLQTEDISFETQRVIFDDDWELTLIFLFHKGSLIDVSDEIDSEDFVGLLLSKEYGFKHFNIN
jgi:hypothetical protein